MNIHIPIPELREVVFFVAGAVFGVVAGGFAVLYLCFKDWRYGG